MREPLAEDESIVKPRSHCQSCDRQLAWWENMPLAELAGTARALPDLPGMDRLAISAWWSWPWRSLGFDRVADFSAMHPHPDFHDAHVFD